MINREKNRVKKINITSGQIKQLVDNAKIHQLEYCLALHAQENAIIQSSKIGGMGLRGGTIYTTAEPCPLCAKKIQKARALEADLDIEFENPMTQVVEE